MNKSEKIRLYYGIFLSVLTAIVGIVFIVKIADLYYSNGAIQGVYTLENIRKYMLLPFIFLLVWIAAIIAGYVLSVVFATKEKKRSPYVDNKKILGLLKARVPAIGKKEGFDEARKSIDRHEIYRKCVWGFTCAVLLAGAIAIMIYAFNPSHYHTDTLRPDILELVRNVIYWIGAGLICSFASVIFEAISLKREVGYVKTAIATGDKDSVPPAKQFKKNLALCMTICSGTITLLAIVLFIIAPSVLTAALTNMPSNQLVFLAIPFLAVVIIGVIAATYVKKYVPEKVDKYIVLGARIALGVIAVTFIIVGALPSDDLGNSGAHDVLVKAINICTECIGLG